LAFIKELYWKSN